MRISIDIDINESEIDLATELLSTLRCAISSLATQDVQSALSTILIRRDDVEARLTMKAY